jgi:DSBA-like thioredoxin domain
MPGARATPCRSTRSRPMCGERVCSRSAGRCCAARSITCAPSTRAREMRVAIDARSGRVVSDPAVLVALTERCGLNGPELLDAADNQAVREEYRGNTARALAAGVFGSPFYNTYSRASSSGVRTVSTCSRGQSCGQHPAISAEAPANIEATMGHHRCCDAQSASARGQNLPPTHVGHTENRVSNFAQPKISSPAVSYKPERSYVDARSS